MDLKEFIKNENDVKSALIGTILADGSINKQRTPNGRSSCEITHTNKNLDYLKIKKEIFEMLPNCKCNIKPKNKATKEKTYYLYRLSTNRHDWFTELRDTIYKNENNKRIKLFRKEEIDTLSDIGLLFMYLDDGCLRIGNNKDGKPSWFRVTFCLESFTLQELQYFQEWLLNKYNIETKLYKHYNYNDLNLGYRIYMYTKPSLKLMDIFNKYYDLIPSMQYKFIKYYLS